MASSRLDLSVSFVALEIDNGEAKDFALDASSFECDGWTLSEPMQKQNVHGYATSAS